MYLYLIFERSTGTWRTCMDTIFANQGWQSTVSLCIHSINCEFNKMSAWSAKGENRNIVDRHPYRLAKMYGHMLPIFLPLSQNIYKTDDLSKVHVHVYDFPNHHPHRSFCIIIPPGIDATIIEILLVEQITWSGRQNFMYPIWRNSYHLPNLQTAIFDSNFVKEHIEKTCKITICKQTSE
jgi:hypothetical protein